MINFIGLQKLRKLKLAVDNGYATPLLKIIPNIQEILDRALMLYEESASKQEILSRPLVGLSDKVGVQEGQWGLSSGVDDIEFVLAIEAIIFACEEVQRD